MIMFNFNRASRRCLGGRFQLVNLGAADLRGRSETLDSLHAER